MAINTTINTSQNNASIFGRAAQLERKPVLRELPGIHVSKGPFCSDNRFPISVTSTFYQHLFSLPVSVQTYLQQILSCFKEKSLRDHEHLTSIHDLLLSRYKELGLLVLKKRRETLLEAYQKSSTALSKRSHPNDLLNILMKLCSRPKYIPFPSAKRSKQQTKDLEHILCA